MELNFLKIKPIKINNIVPMPIIHWYNNMILPENNKNGIVISDKRLIPCIVNNKFSINNLTIKINRQVDKNNNKIFYNNIELRVITFNKNINILLENIILTNQGSKTKYEFVNYDQELFEIIDTTKNQSFYIIFQFIADNIYTKQIFVRFEYKPSNNLGDVNGDGVIDLRDLVALSDHVVQGKAINKPEYADINKTDEITKHDVIELSRRILHG